MPEQLSFMAPQPQPSKGPHLFELRAEVMAQIEDGITCPCCGQYCRLYKRKLNAPMACALIWLVLRKTDTKKDWINIHESPLFQGRRVGGDFAKLEHWRLIESKLNEDETKRCSGLWRPTEKGVAFVEKRITVPAKVHLYNNVIHGWSEEHITIIDALGEKFDYGELMNRDPG